MNIRFLAYFSEHLPNRPYYLLKMALLSGILLSLSWYFPFFIFIFFGLVPLLAFENFIYEHRPRKGYRKLFLGLWLAFFLWNVGVTWWLWNASQPASVAAWLANSALQTLPFLFFHWTKRLSDDRFGYLPLICFWLFFEYVHFNWFLSHPWLQLGNVFAFVPQVVQWYEYTGVLGGTVWILAGNILIFYAIFYRYTWLGSLLMMTVPALISLGIYYNYEDIGKETEALVIQPNIDTYTQKYTYNARTGEDNPNAMSYDQQITEMFRLAHEKITDSTRVVVMPETSMHQTIEEPKVKYNIAFGRSKNFIEKHPNVSILTGVNSRIRYGNQSEAEQKSNTFRQYDDVFYDNYNAALFINSRFNPMFYHKSKLVIGVETNPFGWLFRILDTSLMLNMGGMVGGLGTQNERVAFTCSDNLKVAPVICYESVYGEYVGEYILKGANLITILTNDDWWDNTSGHRQHFHFARLRAIETRRYIARSANTGISGFINQRGDILQRSNYKESAAMLGKVKLNQELTYYVQYGDYLGRLGGFVAITLFLASFVRRKIQK